MSGPPRKPTALRVVEAGGKLRARYRTRAEREPKPDIGVGADPAGLAPDQLAVWRRVVADSPPGLLTRVDRDLVLTYCILTAARDAALASFNRSGGHLMLRSPDDPNRLVLNPYMREFKRLAEALRPLVLELGFGPASRTRIAVTPPPEDGDDFDRFMQGRK